MLQLSKGAPLSGSQIFFTQALEAHMEWSPQISPLDKPAQYSPLSKYVVYSGPWIELRVRLPVGQQTAVAPTVQLSSAQAPVVHMES